MYTPAHGLGLGLSVIMKCLILEIKYIQWFMTSAVLYEFFRSAEAADYMVRE